MSDSAATQAMDETGFSQSNKRAFRNPWVLGWLGFLLLVIGVNAGMIITAVVTNPGLVESDYYEKGRDFERNVAKQLAARSALGWTLSLEPPERARINRPAPHRLTVVDKVGQPLTGATVELHAYRPSDAAADFTVPLTETLPGQYSADIAFPLKGIWDLKVHVSRGEDAFDISRRISVLAQ